MRRIVGYELLMFAFAAVLMTGCSDYSSLEVADGRDAGGAGHEVVLPDSAEAANSVTGDLSAAEQAGTPASRNPNAANGVTESASAEIENGADSDTPGRYQPGPGNQADKSPHAHPHTSAQAAGDEGAPQRNGRSPDGDDPEAPVIVRKVAESPDDAPLNDGREPSAKPLPEAQRTAIEPKDVAPESFENGRAPGAKPGDEVTRPDPAIAKPTKPAAPSRTTLADLAESIQALDKDGDGQLGLYEWPREKLAEFKTLDSNKDGFLTPSELAPNPSKPLAGEKKTSDAETPKTEKAPKEDTKEKDKEKTATKPDAETPPEDAKSPAVETTDKATTPETPDDGAAKKDDPSADKPTPGS